MNIYSHFYNDSEKMLDFYQLSKEDFLKSYSYLTEEEYENTKQIAIQERQQIKESNI